MTQSGLLRCFSSFVAILLAAGALLAQSGRQPQPKPTATPVPEDETVRIATEEVKMNVLALDERGRFVSDVRETDLVVTENDILHQPTSLRRLPANVLIVMDTGGEMRSVKSLDQTRKTALALVAALHQDDLVAIVQYADRAEVAAEWTNDRDALNNAIMRTKFGRRSVFVSAVRLATELLVRSPLDNRHMVLITDGTDSLADARSRQAAFREILGTDISVHVISYTKMESVAIEPRTKAITNSPPPKAMPDEVAAQLPPGVRDRAQAPKIGPTIITDRKHLERMRKRKADLETSEGSLIALSENTNGTAAIPETREEMLEKAGSIAKLIDSSYVLTYTPKIPFSEMPGERDIEVTSRRPGLVVHSRRKLVLGREN